MILKLIYLYLKTGREEKLDCGIINLPRSHKQLCINKDEKYVIMN
jgi:hypothetical protein